MVASGWLTSGKIVLRLGKLRPGAGAPSSHCDTGFPAIPIADLGSIHLDLTSGGMGMPASRNPEWQLPLPIHLKAAQIEGRGTQTDPKILCSW